MMRGPKKVGPKKVTDLFSVQKYICYLFTVTFYISSIYQYMDQRLRNVLGILRATGKYNSIVEKVETTRPLPMSFVFEALFASTFIENGLILNYEENLVGTGNSTIDFLYTCDDGQKCCFELVRPEMSEELKIECEPETTEADGVYTWEALLHGEHQQEHLRPEAQTIRMQEKILEKVISGAPILAGLVKSGNSKSIYRHTNQNQPWHPQQLSPHSYCQ